MIQTNESTTADDEYQDIFPSRCTAVSPQADFCVLRSPMHGQYIVARPGEQGTAGWQKLHGPDTSDGCWNWIYKTPRHGMRF
jgi:uncharacterized protein YbdZ (MbtH family)